MIRRWLHYCGRAACDAAAVREENAKLAIALQRAEVEIERLEATRRKRRPTPKPRKGTR